MKRVGLVGQGFTFWGGGVDFLRMVSESLCASGADLEVHILLPVRGPRIAARAVLTELQSIASSVRRGEVIAQIGRLSRSIWQRDASDADTHARARAAEWGSAVSVHMIDSGAGAAAAAADRLRLDALLPALVPLGHKTKRPWVGYLYDFQHRHMPHFFPADEIKRRDEAFRAMLVTAPAVVVNSRAVADDACAFHPAAASRIVALPFSASVKPEWLAAQPEVAGKYGIEGPYFIVCNQFWQHKDHGTAFKAFASLSRTWPAVSLVCTGSKGDWRNPEYFPSLMRQAEALGITGRLRILGHISKNDQIALLRGAVALVQPTLFEGGPGGGACYDAIGLGVTCLVSDIAVNRELDEPEVRFFAAGDADALAICMDRVLTEGRRPAVNDSILLQRGSARRAHCGLALLHAIEIATNARSGRHDSPHLPRI